MSKLPMNLPNKLTLLRIFIIPLYFIALVIDPNSIKWGAFLLFCIASVTDWFDGRIARNRNEVTNFGKFMDPIADKLLVLLPMVYFSAVPGTLSVWATIIMVAREIVVSGFRLVAVTTKGNIISAGWTGKIKTSVQMLCVLLLTLGMNAFGGIAGWIAAILSLSSGAEIIVKNRSVLEEAA